MGAGKNNNSLKKVLFAGAGWDIIGGLIFFVFHGILQVQLSPEIHPFYSIVTGLFLFLLAYIQVICALNTKSNALNIGAIVLFRIFYGLTVILFSFLQEMLPLQFFIIALVDNLLVALLIYSSISKEGLTFTELFKAP